MVLSPYIELCSTEWIAKYRNVDAERIGETIDGIRLTLDKFKTILYNQSQVEPL